MVAPPMLAPTWSFSLGHLLIALGLYLAGRALLDMARTARKYRERFRALDALEKRNRRGESTTVELVKLHARWRREDEEET